MGARGKRVRARIFMIAVGGSDFDGVRQISREFGVFGGRVRVMIYVSRK